MNVSIHYSIQKIASVTGAKVLGKDAGNFLEYISLDSRKIIAPQTTVFFSIKNTPNRTGQIVAELYEKGVAHFVIDHPPDIKDFQDAVFCVVNDSLIALQMLAEAHRKQFDIPVIGITGSNGKTIIKEWLYQLLHTDHDVCRSPRSYNSQIGVPLSLLQLKAENTLGIFEAGISEPHEMEALERMIRPTIGIFTNIGGAHNEGFASMEEKIKEKLILFKNVQHLIYCADDEVIDKQIRNNLSRDIQLFTWSRNNKGSLHISSSEIRKGKSILNAVYNHIPIQIVIPFIDDASIENAIHCLATLLLLNVAPNQIGERFSHLHAVEMRLELKQGANNSSIINDSYSSDIYSLQVALDFLNQQKQHDSTTVILSDIFQSGYEKEKLYSIVSKQLLSKNIHRLIGIGPEISAHARLFSKIPQTQFYASVSEFKKDLYHLHFNNEAILLKGARVFEFEQISFMLEQKVHQTILSINLSAVAHNLKQYRNQLKPTTKIMAMVKAFSYGSGAFEIARVLQYNKVDYLAVAYTDEGVTLRKAGITLPIMVMNPEESSFNTIVRYFLEPELFSFKILNAFKEYLSSQALQNYPVHIKIDTGMHRLGFDPEDIAALGAIILNGNELHVQSVFSHLIASNDADKKALTFSQFKIFSKNCNELEEMITYPFIKHIANSSAISSHPELQMDMVRAGIGIYGIDSNMGMQKKLKNVTTLTTTIAQIKLVKKNETVGYGDHFKLQRDSKIATIRIGYADGYHRIFSNGTGKVMIRNFLASVVGNICMDMTMIDVSDLENVKEGDSVEIFGDHLPISDLAKWSRTIPYEIMTNISQRVKRVYFEE